jgi:hypothetical protein
VRDFNEEFNETFRKCPVCCAPVELNRVLQAESFGKPVKTVFRQTLCSTCSPLSGFFPVPPGILLPEAYPRFGPKR